MEVDKAKSNQAAHPAAPDESAALSPRRPPWYQRVSFWRAIAGMAIAAALAATLAATETASDLFHRSSHYRHRMVQLDARVKKMRGEIAARETLSRVLAAPDARMIRLATPQGGGHASAIVAISAKLGSAALEVHGLAPAPVNHSYVLFWSVARHAPIRAAAFQTTRDGDAIIQVSAPLPVGVRITGGVVTLEEAGDAIKPGNVIVLRGHVSIAN